MIEIRELKKSFGSLQVLRSLNLELQAGQIVCLIGPNGSGKTTLIKCLLGHVLPDSGTIRVAGEQLVAGSWSYRERIGYMPQIGRYPEQMRIRQVFSMMRDIRNVNTSSDEELYQRFGLEALQEKRMGNLSGGTRQKVSAALAFLFRPDLVVLDEPTAGLDPVSSELLKDKLRAERERGTLTLITSHNMSEVEELADRVVFLVDGNLLNPRFLPNCSV
ncbi:MAG TPA: ABC transporter ATP-binding protein, partial [Bacteroidia bacterium]|nr:ABC transporter ATP-binding protein [Bacteroidia bacterium]